MRNEALKNLTSRARKVQAVEVEGETLYIRALTAGDSLRIGKQQGNSLDYLAASICTETGDPLLPSVEETRKALEEIPVSAMTTVMAAVNKLNGVGEEGQEKNSETTP